MVAIQPSANPNGRYSVSDTCALLGIHRNTLLNATNRGAIKCGYRDNFRKYYTGYEIIRFWKKN